jgi:integrase
MKLRLDTRTVTALALSPGQRELFAWDTELPGFGLRLQGSKRTYVAQYRSNGHTRRPTIGPVDRLTTTQAREAARKLLAKVSLGHDPQGEKAAQRLRAALTFVKVAEAYIAAKQDEWRPASLRAYKRYLLAGAYFRPLHAMALDEIKHPDVAARLSAITRGHGAHTASAARRAIAAMFKWAMEEGWCGSNPVIGTRRPAEAPARDRVLSDAELVAIWRACDGCDDDFSRIVRLLILLGSRRQEVGGMRWSELDLDAGTWILPAARSKNHRAHTVALPPTALAIIRAWLRLDRDCLFGDRSERGFTIWDTEKVALNRRLGDAVQPWRLHDLRRTTATRMADIGIEPHHIEACLNHYSNRSGVAGIYNRSTYDRAVKAALLRWDAHVLALVEGRASKVVTLHA